VNGFRTKRGRRQSGKSGCQSEGVMGSEQRELSSEDGDASFQEKLLPIKLQGLNPEQMYKVEEINLMPGVASTLDVNGKIFSGDYLMKVGLNAFTTTNANSRVIEITAQ
jgi:alpha-galactosidase